MNNAFANGIDVWEDEGGAVAAATPSLRGNPAQVEWGERIKVQVDQEFDRVARAFRSVAEHQAGSKRTGTEAIIGILESLRREVMSQEDSGYFIRDWQEISDQVRRMILKDPRYRALKLP